MKGIMTKTRAGLVGWVIEGENGGLEGHGLAKTTEDAIKAIEFMFGKVEVTNTRGDDMDIKVTDEICC